MKCLDRSSPQTGEEHKPELTVYEDMETHTNQDNGEAFFHEVKEILDRADTKFLDHECDHREEHEPGWTPPRTLYQISNGLPCKPGDLMIQGPLW